MTVREKQFQLGKFSLYLKVYKFIHTNIYEINHLKMTQVFKSNVLYYKEHRF